MSIVAHIHPAGLAGSSAQLCKYPAPPHRPSTDTSVAQEINLEKVAEQYTTESQRKIFDVVRKHLPSADGTGCGVRRGGLWRCSGTRSGWGPTISWWDGQSRRSGRWRNSKAGSSAGYG
ncbi:hypothetical protein LZ31DRAFT_556350 [Colletotrichum somersetense]|nr:hypothetical protein LZ31DRAFT_556350 [Colletotrichum somersetense]